MGRRALAAGAAVLVLAGLCVGATELSAAPVEPPEAYEEFVQPLRDAEYGVRRIWNAAREGVKSAVERRRAEKERQRQEREREEARRREETARRIAMELAAIESAQVASEPAIQDEAAADPAVTEFLSVEGREVLTGGNVTLYYYNQGDEAWAEKPFGRDPIGRYGCGPTVMAMAAASLAEDAAATPESVALWTAQAGYCAPGSGSYLSIVEGAAAHYGLDCESLAGADADALYEALSEGGLVVALVGPGHFTGGGHFILLHGVTLTGEVLVADPNSRDNSLAVWDPQTIVDELSKSRHDGAPLWHLTKPLDL